MKDEGLASSGGPRSTRDLRRLRRDRHLYWGLTALWVTTLAAFATACGGLLTRDNAPAVLLGFGIPIYAVGNLRPRKRRN